MKYAHACDGKKKNFEVRTCTFKKKTHSTRSSWKMREVNCDSRVNPTSVAHTESLGFLSNPRQPLLHKFFRNHPISLSFNEIDGPMVSLYDLKSRKFHLVIYQSITIHFHQSMVHAVNPEALYFLVVQSNRSFK